MREREREERLSKNLLQINLFTKQLCRTKFHNMAFLQNDLVGKAIISFIIVTSLADDSEEYLPLSNRLTKQI